MLHDEQIYNRLHCVDIEFPNYDPSINASS
jgi:hypothetical protein